MDLAARSEVAARRLREDELMEAGNCWKAMEPGKKARENPADFGRTFAFSWMILGNVWMFFPGDFEGTQNLGETETDRSGLGEWNFEISWNCKRNQ